MLHLYFQHFLAKSHQDTAFCEIVSIWIHCHGGHVYYHTDKHQPIRADCIGHAASSLAPPPGPDPNGGCELRCVPLRRPVPPRHSPTATTSGASWSAPSSPTVRGVSSGPGTPPSFGETSKSTLEGRSSTLSLPSPPLLWSGCKLLPPSPSLLEWVQASF